LQTPATLCSFAYFANKYDLDLSDQNRRIRGSDDGTSLHCSRLGNLCILRDGFDTGKHLFKIKCRVKCPNLSNQIGFLTNPKCVDMPNGKSLHLSQCPDIGLSYYLMSNGKLYHYNGFENYRRCYMDDECYEKGVDDYKEAQMQITDMAKKKQVAIQHSHSHSHSHHFTEIKWKNGDIIVLLLDCDNKEITFFVNHVLVGVIKNIPANYSYFLAVCCCSKISHCDYQCIQ
ncbi:hypothetical protein RFI_17226, partial [Reticulomyxa filosa]